MYVQHDNPWKLLYADDFMLEAASRKDLQHWIQAWHDWLNQLVSEYQESRIYGNLQ